MKSSRVFLAPFVALAVLGCASQPDKIQTAYVSTLQYNNYDCEQLSMEAERVSSRTIELYQGLKKTADDDALQMGVGLVLFWPTLFFLEGGDDTRAHEYSRLKGEREAIEKVSIQKKCTIQFPPLEPVAPAKTASPPIVSS
ncbi:hypothetical protein JCM17960_11550 [Magnetospira thiophila]